MSISLFHCICPSPLILARVRVSERAREGVGVKEERSPTQLPGSPKTAHQKHPGRVGRGQSVLRILEPTMTTTSAPNKPWIALSEVLYVPSLIRVHPRDKNLVRAVESVGRAMQEEHPKTEPALDPLDADYGTFRSYLLPSYQTQDVTPKIQGLILRGAVVFVRRGENWRLWWSYRLPEFRSDEWLRSDWEVILSEVGRFDTLHRNEIASRADLERLYLMRLLRKCQRSRDWVAR